MESTSPAENASDSSSRSTGDTLVWAFVSVVGSIAYVVSAYVIAIVLSLGVLIFLIPIWLWSGGLESIGELEYLAVAMMAADTLLLGVAAGLLAIISIGTDVIPKRELGLSMPSGRQVLVSVGAAAGLVLLASGLEVLAEFAGVAPSEHTLMDEELTALGYFALVPISIVLIGPIEELLFRGLIQNFARKGLGSIGGVVWTSLLFAAIHLPAYFLVGLDGVFVSLGFIFVISLVLGGLYERQRNLPVVALVHGVYNAILFALAGFNAL